jgi:hypothetical protein
MSQDLPIPRQDNRSDGTTVVEWGAAEPAPRSRARRPLADLTRDRRLPLLLTGLGAVAAVASLVGEWLVMTVPNGGPQGNTTIRVPGGVADVGGFGVAYLVGLLALAAVVALALGGTAGARHNARVAGLALAAALFALLAAAALALDGSSQRTLFYSSEDGFRVDYGRGLVMAFLATALLAAALQLAGRLPAGQPRLTDAESAAEPTGQGRRNRPAATDDRPPAPADLTVEPTVPFARPETSS